MNKIINITLIVLSSLLLPGCGIDDDEPKSNAEKYPWDGEFLAKTASGIMVNVRPAEGDVFTNSELSKLLLDVDEQWYSVQECMNVFEVADRPFVIDYREDVKSAVRGFLYWTDDYTYSRIMLSDRYPLSKFKTTRHEMVHYLLFLGEIDKSGDADHSSIFFKNCE